MRLILLCAVAALETLPHLVAREGAAEPFGRFLGAIGCRAARGSEPLSSYNIDRGYRNLVADEARVANLRKRLATYTIQR